MVLKVSIYLKEMEKRNEGERKTKEKESGGNINKGKL